MTSELLALCEERENRKEMLFKHENYILNVGTMANREEVVNKCT